jgi:VWFA-related protein
VIAAESPKGAITFEETVRLVDVPVWVLGSGGLPVTDLSAADFTLKEDGKEREIAFFELVDYSRPTAQTLRFPRQFLFLFDGVFSEPFAIVKGRRAAIDFVERTFGASDVAAVALITATEGIKLVCNFTSDKRVLTEALDTLGYAGWTSDVRGPSQFALLTSAPSLTRGPGQAPAPEPSDAPDGGAGREIAAEREREILQRLRAEEISAALSDFRRYKQFAGQMFGSLDRLGAALRSLEGVKHVVFFSQGVEERVLGTQSLESFARGAEAFLSAASSADAAAEALVTENQSETSFGDAGLRGLLEQSLLRMASNSVRVHTVDISGLRPGSENAAANTKDGAQGLTFLTMVASETDGQLLKNTNDMTGALAQMAESTRALYMLAFYPKKMGTEGKHHKLEVKVKRKGLDVVHRPGYFEDRPFAQYSPLERQFQLAQAIVKPDQFNTGFIPPSYAGAFPLADGKVRIPVVTEIPLDRFTPDPKGNLRVEAYGFILDDRGQFHDYFERMVSLPKAELDKNNISAVKLLEQFISQGPGDYQVRVVARDAFGGRIGSASLELTVPDFAAHGLALSAPVFRTGDSASYPLWRMPEYRKGGEGPEAAGPGLPEILKGGAANPSPVPELKPGQPAEISFRVFDLKLHPQTQQPQINMAFSCRDAGGTEIKVHEIKLAGPPPQPEPGVFDLTLQLRVPELAPGEWNFVVSFTDTLAKRTATAIAPFRVATAAS